MRGDSGVAGEGRVVGVPNFHSWGKCTMPLTNINSDWVFNASSGLCIILVMGPALQHHNELAEMHPILLPASILYTMHSWCTLLDWPICQSSFTS